MYRVPDEFYIRLHQCRPRFKNNIEDVLLFMASEICTIGELPNEAFADQLNGSIKLFQGNASKSKKTIDNWRTEISSLLGLIEYTDNGTSKPSQMAHTLDQGQDLIEFFRFFCFKFQYPGGHLKPARSLELIQSGVKFKPAQYILKLLIEANKGKEKKFGISKEEATHCMFNDLRVVRDNRAVEDTIQLIQFNRDNNLDYDCNGDIVRYAGDILDYMELANLVDRKPNGKYYPRTIEFEVISAIIDSEEYFAEYDELYIKEKVFLSDVNDKQNAWFKYVNSGLKPEIFQTDILKIVEQDAEEQTENSFIVELLESIRRKKEVKGKVRTKDIGDVGEAIAIQHEQIRLTNLERPDLAKKVVKMPEALSAGYDLNSFEGEAEIKRCIEVKTTISRNKLAIQRFHMTPNEWGAAETFKDAYYIYRLMISANNVSLFVMKNPVGLYKRDVINMTPRDGIDISYSERAGYFEEILS